MSALWAQTGGYWNGLGSVGGLVTSSSNTLTIGSGANLTAPSGLNVTAGQLAAADRTATLTAALNYTSAASSTFAGTIAGSGASLILNNAATILTLSGSNTYGGATTITAGTLRISASGSIAAASAIAVSNSSTLAVTASTNLPGNSITVSAGSIFDTTGAGNFSLGSGNLLTIGRTSGTGTDINGNFTLGGGTINIGGTGTAATLTEAGNLTLAGGAMQFDLSSTGASDLLKATNLNLSSATAININMLGGSLNNGSYPLIDYSGSLAGSLSTLTLNSLASGTTRQTFALATSGSSPGELLLQVTSLSANLVWTGSQSGTWDTAALNWSNSGTADKFYNGDTVTFNDTANTATITLNMNVQPQSVLFNNNLLNYTLTGSGGIGGSGSLTKNGSGMLTLGGSNSYSGGTNVNQGVLQLATANAVPNSTVSVNVPGGLIFSSGIGAFSLGGLAGSGAFALSDTGGAAVALNVGGDNGTATYSGSLGGGGSLTKTGNGGLTLSGNNQYTGSTQASGGTLVVEGGSSSSSFTANNGGTLQFSGATINLGFSYVRAMTGGSVQYQNATINGGFLLGPGTHTFLACAANNLNGTTINNGAVLQQNGTTNFTDVANAGQISSNSNASLNWLGGSNAASGAITVYNSAAVNVSSWYNDGVITINNGGLLNNSVSNLVSGGGSQIYVNSGGTLNADSNVQGVTLDLQGSLLVNNGTVTGTTNVYYGATVQGKGTFGPINVYNGGTLALAATANLVAQAWRFSAAGSSGPGNPPRGDDCRCHDHRAEPDRQLDAFWKSVWRGAAREERPGTAGPQRHE